MQTNAPIRKHSSKRQTVQVAAWVKPSIRAELQHIAQQEGLSMSHTCTVLLEEAIRQKLHTQHAIMLQPIVEQAVHKEIRAISNRLALLLARGVYENGQTKR